MTQVKRSTLARYGLPALLVVLAATITWLVPGMGQRVPFALFYVPVIIAALYGGRGPALLAVALSLVAGAYLFLPPAYTFHIDIDGLIRLLTFFLITLMLSLVIERIRRAEAQAEESREQLFTTLRSIGDAVIATDARGVVTFLNEVAQGLTGWSLEEAKGKELREIFHIVNEKTRLGVESPVVHVLRDGNIVGLANHTILISRDGKEIPIDDSGAPIRNRDGKITGVVLVFRDITERRQAEVVSQRLASIVESSEDVIFSKTLDGIITSWNASAERLYGYSAEEIIGRPVSILVPPERPDEVPGILDRLKRGERVEHFETKRVTKDGRILEIALTISPIKDNEGAIIGASTIARDITERKRVEEALRAGEDRYRAFVENSSEAIWRFELTEPVSIDLPLDEQIENFYRHGYLGECNDAMAAMYGFKSAGELVGAKLDDLLVRDDPNNVEYLRAFINSGYRMTEAESHEVDREGNSKYFLNNFVGIIEDGKLLRGWGTQRDITERRRAEQEREQLLEREQALRTKAEEANRLKDEFLATLSHELRTPLTAMIGWTRMLRLKELDEPTAEHALETVERNAKAQAQLIEDLLDVSRIITGNLRLDVRPLEILPIIEAAMDAVQPAANAKLIKLEASLDPRAGPVSGDATRLQQVVWNLIFNAVKFTPKGGHVSLRLERNHSHVEIIVSDTGQGISSDFLPFVFDRFRQADGSTTRAHGGLGLGLAIARHLVELHGGTVHAESAGVGHGATFKVRLPLIEKQESESRSQNSE
jgi:PAS domain S-box-containing protein